MGIENAALPPKLAGLRRQRPQVRILSGAPLYTAETRHFLPLREFPSRDIRGQRRRNCTTRGHPIRGRSGETVSVSFTARPGQRQSAHSRWIVTMRQPQDRHFSFSSSLCRKVPRHQPEGQQRGSWESPRRALPGWGGGGRVLFVRNSHNSTRADL